MFLGIGSADGVVPLRQSVAGLELDGAHLAVAHLDASRVRFVVEHGLNTQARRGLG